MAASAIGRASPVRAEGETIHVGDEFTTATSTTTIINNANNATVLTGASNQNGVGVHGHSVSYRGIDGTAVSGTGVHGFSSFGVGVRGQAFEAVGVHGSSEANVNDGTGDRAGVLGEGTLSEPGVATVGVWGRSTNNVGVYGTSQSSNAISGVSTTGIGVFGQGHQSIGVFGYSLEGRAIQGATSSGYAGYFAGKVFTTKYYEMTEITTPPAPVSAERARLFVRDSGGKTQLCVRFHTGAVRVLATEA